MELEVPRATTLSEGPLGTHLKELLGSATEVVRQSTAECRPQLGRVLQLDLDIRAWEDSLSDQPATRQLSDARRQLGMAVFCAAEGLYGQAYAGLRLFLELAFASVHFSVDELHRRQWLSGVRDYSWAEGLDKEVGMLSRSFVSEFNEGAAAEVERFSASARRCYRECSEFVHGKSHHSSRLPAVLGFSKEVLEGWTSVASDAAESVLFLLYCRHGADLLGSSDHLRVSETLEHNFSHLRSVRFALGLPIEKEGNA